MLLLVSAIAHVEFGAPHNKCTAMKCPAFKRAKGKYAIWDTAIHFASSSPAPKVCVGI